MHAECDSCKRDISRHSGGRPRDSRQNVVYGCDIAGSSGSYQSKEKETGCMLSAIAASGISPATVEDVREIVDKMLFTGATSPEVLDLIRAKKKKLDAC